MRIPVAFSICRLLPAIRVQSHAFATCGKLAFAPYACPGTQEFGDNIAAVFAKGIDCVLLENHGVVIGAVTKRRAQAETSSESSLALAMIVTSTLSTRSRSMSTTSKRR